MTRILPIAAALAALLACGPEKTAAPKVSDLSTESHTDLFDRAALLEDAADPGVASEGEPLDLRAAGEGYLLEAYNGEALTAAADELPRMYTNYLAGVAAVVAVDITTAVVIASPAIAVAVAADGEITQTGFNTWEATNTIDLAGEPVTTRLTVAWIGVGWLSEMRITSSEFDDQLWFNGFVSHEAAIGWWDFYENGTTHAAVVEWSTDGVDGQFGYGALTGEYAGDVVLYTHVDGVGTVSVYDASVDELVWVSANEDLSGSVRLLDFNGGEEACWDADLLDAACPE